MAVAPLTKSVVVDLASTYFLALSTKNSNVSSDILSTSCGDLATSVVNEFLIDYFIILVISYKQFVGKK